MCTRIEQRGETKSLKGMTWGIEGGDEVVFLSILVKSAALNLWVHPPFPSFKVQIMTALHLQAQHVSCQWSQSEHQLGAEVMADSSPCQMSWNDGTPGAGHTYHFGVVADLETWWNNFLWLLMLKNRKILTVYLHCKALPPGVPLTNFYDGKGEGSDRGSYFIPQKNHNFRICLPKEIPTFLTYPQKIPSFFFATQKHPSVFFATQKKSRCLS